MQIVGIMFVVLGHSFHEYPDGCHVASILVHRMIFSFHMPMFMFVSGFLLVLTTFLRNADSNISYRNL